MRRFTYALVTLSLLANQVVASLPILSTDLAVANAYAEGKPKYKIMLNLKKADAIEIVATKKANFDTEVLLPLRAAQKAEAQAEQVRTLTKIQVVKVQKPIVIGGDDAWAQLRYCEAGGDYTKNTGNGYYGAYQYNLGTWNNYAGYARPDLAPPAIQDAKARATQSARGWSPWPACARRLGLL